MLENWSYFGVFALLILQLGSNQFNFDNCSEVDLRNFFSFKSLCLLFDKIDNKKVNEQSNVTGKNKTE